MTATKEVLEQIRRGAYEILLEEDLKKKLEEKHEIYILLHFSSFQWSLN